MAKNEQEATVAWVYGKGVKDIEGNPVDPGSYAYVKEIGPGMQPGATDSIFLKYPAEGDSPDEPAPAPVKQARKKTYRTRQIKAEE